MPVYADHFVVLVHDLEAASRDYGELGFTVQSRQDSKPGHGSVYRFVVLEDRSYILLTQFVSAEAAANHRLGPDLQEGEGCADYSFAVPSVAASAAALTAEGGQTRGPVDVSNVLVDGSEWGLRLLMAGKGTGGDTALPFLVEDVVGRAHRVPPFRPHANGVTRLAGMTISSADAAATARSLGLILGLPAEPQGEGFCILASPAPVVVLPSNGRTRRARARGGVDEIRVYGPHDAVMDLARTHGVRLHVVRPAA